MRNVLYISSYSMLRGLGFSTLYVYSAVYITSVLGGSFLFDGIIFAVGGSLAAVGQYYGGSISDRIGYSITIKISLALSLMVMILLSFDSMASHSLYSFSALFMGLLVANSLQSPSSNALLSSSTDAKLRGFSILRVANNLGWGVGPAIGGFLISFGKFHTLFVYAMILVGASLIVSLLLSDPEKKPLLKTGFRTDNRLLILLSLASLMVFIVQSQETVTLSNFVRLIRDFPYYYLGIIYMTNGLFVIVSQAPVYRLIRKIGNYYSFGIGSIIYSAGFFSYAADPSLFWMVVSTIVLTVGEDFAFPTGLTIVSEISRPERIGKNMGIYNSFLQFGRAVGPIISGLAFTITLNPYLLWSITSFWGVAGAIMFFIVFRGGIRNPFQDSTPQVISGK
ncbi:MAG: MFS transporter [Candidatus Thermoplasmatota archaeon]|nr:MFS transporter [Candidatus Thermoplasmatota archaeon]